MLSQTLTVFTTNLRLYSFFFFNDTATTEIYTLSLHDALPISSCRRRNNPVGLEKLREGLFSPVGARPDARSQPKARLRILRSEEHTSELQSRLHLVCRLLLEKKKKSRRASFCIEICTLR